MGLYSIKMRSSKDDNHISGAEKIIKEENIEEAVNLLLKRALLHSKGKSDFINIKIEKVKESELETINPLDVTTVDVNNYIEGLDAAKTMLMKLGINKEKSQNIINLLREVSNMRGAILLDINTMERLEPDKQRGIRATYMDFEDSNINHLTKETKYNGHFIEALALASKVVNCPYIIGEVCYSDDPNYTAGYVASKKYGYVRFPHLKELGNENGGRVFLYDSSISNLQNCIDYIEKSKVVIKNDIKINRNLSYKKFIQNGI
ncbi:6-carboxyhexanoate--CoA ligase [Clostridium sp. CCUG 7971]|uniref:6-carboxyhexanoate--CoA ligase n=1 Tax=Clostridium sp. CCUG 7971 TaxID=2811414 RepID=UPI00256FC0B2|nr:6-carboxyhexanoate--CoA ligase [Clostridium sp. CCUG 7971]